MRVVAALSVLVGHLTGVEVVGRSGVLVFFALSGYLLYGRLLAGEAVPTFYLRRVARIYPGYVVALIGAAILTGERPDWSFLVFGQNYSPATMQQFLAPSWTLVLEMTFYAVLPLVAIWRPSVLVLVLVALASWMGQQATQVVGLDAGWANLTYRLFPVQMWAFVPGMIAAMTGRGSLWGLGLVAAHLAVPTFAFDWMAAVGAGIAIPAIARLRVPTWQWPVLGGASYAAYLWQWTLLEVGALVWLPVVSISSWLLVERPFVRWASHPKRADPKREVGIAGVGPA